MIKNTFLISCLSLALQDNAFAQEAETQEIAHQDTNTLLDDTPAEEVLGETSGISSITISFGHADCETDRTNCMYFSDDISEEELRAAGYSLEAFDAANPDADLMEIGHIPAYMLVRPGYQ